MILVDPAERVLLVGIEEPVSLGPGVFWIIPGVGLEAGDTFAAAARREVWEETGISIVELGPCVWTRRLPLTFNG